VGGSEVDLFYLFPFPSTSRKVQPLPRKLFVLTLLFYISQTVFAMKKPLKIDVVAAAIFPKISHHLVL
jgi:hypothetical protein